MKNLAEKISASELEVMQVLWEAGDALPLADIRKTLQSRFDWSDPTVKTLIRFPREILRGDPRAVVGPLSIGQTISLALLLAGLAFAVAAFRRPRQQAT